MKLWILGTVLLTACTQTLVKFKSKDPVRLRLLDAHGHVSDEVLGITPLTLTADKIEGKAVQAQAPRKRPQYWYFLPLKAHETDIALDLEIDPYEDKDREQQLDRERDRDRDRELAQAKVETAVQRNRFVRVLMAAYQALSRDESEEALRLANEAASLQADLAGPEIIRGLALVKLKKFGPARLAFRRAKVLDPQDPNIEVLLKSLDE